MINVLFVSFESLPFVKTGGLADVVAALPQALDHEKYDVKVVLPLLKTIKDKYMSDLHYVDHIYINSGIIHEEANIYNLYLNNLEYIFIENDTYFYRDGVYGYNDDVIRFAVFNNAVLEMMIKCDYYPDICHEHDYHTAVLPALCKIRYDAIEKIRRIKHVFTIHNLAYQGVYNKKVLFDFLGFDYRYFEDGSLRFNDDANFMKIGIVFADIVTTVSKTYSYEIQTPQFGENLEAVLQYRRGDLYGIVNGIDTKLFDPAKDPDIRYNFSVRNYKAGKRENKAAVQESLGLQVRPNTFLVGMISRLTSQKGVDLLISSIDHWMQRDCEIAILGTGDSKYEYQLKMMEERYKTRCVYYCGYADWRSGFFPGSVWYLYELTGDTTLLPLAVKYTEAIEEAKNLTWHHDIGFIINCSFGNGLRLAGTPAYKEVIIQAARSLATRFRPVAGIIQSWNVDRGWQSERGWECPVIIDNMMNLELLFEATRLSGDSTYY